jgi:hypothetical protein
MCLDCLPYAPLHFREGGGDKQERPAQSSQGLDDWALYRISSPFPKIVRATISGNG